MKIQQDLSSADRKVDDLTAELERARDALAAAKDEFANKSADLILEIKNLRCACSLQKDNIHQVNTEMVVAQFLLRRFEDDLACSQTEAHRLSSDLKWRMDEIENMRELFHEREILLTSRDSSLTEAQLTIEKLLKDNGRLVIELAEAEENSNLDFLSKPR